MVSQKDRKRAEALVGKKAFKALSKRYKWQPLTVCICVCSMAALIQLDLREPDPSEARMFADVMKALGLKQAADEE